MLLPFGDFLMAGRHWGKRAAGRGRTIVRFNTSPTFAENVNTILDQRRHTVTAAHRLPDIRVGILDQRFSAMAQFLVNRDGHDVSLVGTLRGYVAFLLARVEQVD